MKVRDRVASPMVDPSTAVDKEFERTPVHNYHGPNEFCWFVGRELRRMKKRYQLRDIPSLFGDLDLVPPELKNSHSLFDPSILSKEAIYGVNCVMAICKAMRPEDSVQFFPERALIHRGSQ
jgi:hypothetical protein